MLMVGINKLSCAAELRLHSGLAAFGRLQLDDDDDDLLKPNYSNQKDDKYILGAYVGPVGA